MFMPIRDGQGLGNILNGLLAAHLLGDEFHRRVCVSKTFKGFHLAFEPVEAGVAEECSMLPQAGGFQFASDVIHGNAIVLYNFGMVPNECALRDALASSENILFFTGNTYPRWPMVPDQFFAKLYRPKQAFLNMLPWTTPPETVVHLRAPDTFADSREGLDDVTLRLLGESLPHTTFLVTNKVPWYDFFESKYGWAHPDWEEVSHSAMRQVSWGTRTSNLRKQNSKPAATGLLSNEDQQTLAMFCDWYTISQAKHVVHTHSDFSISAIHFMNIRNSQTITGSSSSFNGKLALVDESWRREGETARLVDRAPDNLRLCNAPPHGGIGQ